MSNINASALANLDRDALVALLLTLVSDEVAQEPAEATATKVETKGNTLAPCGSTRTRSGDPCGTKTQGGRDCGQHKHDDATLARLRKQDEEFLAKRRTYAKRAKAKGTTSKADNKGLAAALRAVGVTPNGEAWGIAKGHVHEDGMTFEQAAAKVAPDYA